MLIKWAKARDGKERVGKKDGGQLLQTPAT